MFTFKVASTSALDELVFENRNKNYGAYEIRRSYSDSILKSFFYTMLIVGAILGTVHTINKVFAKNNLKQFPDIDSIRTTVLPNVLPNEQKTEPKKNIAKSGAISKQTTSKRLSNEINETEQNLQKSQDTDLGKSLINDSTDTGKDIEGSIAGGSMDTGKKNEGEEDGGLYENDFGVDVKATFPGGEEALQTFLRKNLSYPRNASAARTQGLAIIQFIVDKNGHVTDVKIIRPLKNGCGEEAMRVVKKMPDWIPAMLKGKPVNVTYRLPVRFIRAADDDD